MKKILIIGGGISGLTAGIFAQKSGFESIIYEKHNILGGECTGWDRGEYHIDGCIHWLTGTKEGHELNKIWKQVGALGNVNIYKPDKFITVEHEGRQISIHRDLNKLKEDFLEISPEDSEEIENLIENIKNFEKVQMPYDKPLDMMSTIEIIKFGMPMRKLRKILKVMSDMSVEEFCSRFKSPFIKKALISVIPSNYNAASLMFALATFTGDNGDFPAGGSKAMVERMVEKYLGLGGKIKTNTEIEEILIDEGNAYGVKKKSGSEEYGNYIIPACDTFVTLNNLLKGKYVDKKFTDRYSDSVRYPLPSCVYLSFAVDADMTDYPEKFVFDSAPYHCGDKVYHEVSLNHYCYEDFAPKGKSIAISAIMTDKNDYLFWNDLKKQNPSKYKEEKLGLANKIITCIEQRFPELTGKIEILDVATPVTYERYCGAYQGAWMSFVPTPKSEQMIHDGKIKGIKSLYMTGQWLMPPGGLPVALITGKWVIQRICEKEKVHFVK